MDVILADMNFGLLGLIVYFLLSYLMGKGKKKLSDEQPGGPEESPRKKPKTVFDMVRELQSGLTENLAQELKDGLKEITGEFPEPEPVAVKPIPVEPEPSMSESFHSSVDGYPGEYDYGTAMDSGTPPSVTTKRKGQSRGLKNIAKRSRLKRAVLWHEIIGKPMALREPEKSL